MLKNKKIALAASFCLGATMFVTTAFADIASKTGYDQLKDAVKYTSEACSKKLQSFTYDATITLKDNGKVLMTENAIEKVDNSNKRKESSSSSEYANGEKTSSYTYRDSKSMVWYSSGNDTYYVTEYDSIGDNKIVNNAFEEDRVKDYEKILDALVGNLKDYVVVDEKADSSKELSGTLNEAQIPALVNAVSSFGFRQIFPGIGMQNNKMSMPEILDDLFIRNITGKAVVNKDGILESIFASGVLSGKDKDGNQHDLTIEGLVKIRDINSTSVEKPDLTGKKVEKQAQKSPGQEGITKKFIGKYKNDIVIEKNNAYVKIGERIIEIVDIDDKHAAGRYYESYKAEYADYNQNKYDFRFDAEIKDYNNAEFEYTNPSGGKDKGSISFDTMGGKVYFMLNSQPGVNGLMYDPGFSRVFDE